jgi:uncharacterized membrane protein YbhN (UPF0104 family)
MPKEKARRSSIFIRLAVSVAVLFAGVYVLVRNWHTVQQSLKAAEDAQLAWLAVAVALMALTFVIAAAIYGTLAQHRLRYRSTLLVELAAAFVNRLLPSGIGGLGLHGIYLYHQKHTGAEATVVVSVNNLIGMVAHLLLLAAVLVWDPSLLHRFTAGRHLVDWRIAMAVLIVILAVLAAASGVRNQIKRFMANLMASVRQIHPGRVGAALLLAMLLTVTYTLILYSIARSLSLQLSLLQIFIVFSVGMLASTATPTPGGLVGAEAGLFAGLFAYGVAAPVAGAVALLYRLATYWLPLFPGVIAVLLARRKRLI